MYFLYASYKGFEERFLARCYHVHDLCIVIFLYVLDALDAVDVVVIVVVVVVVAVFGDVLFSTSALTAISNSFILIAERIQFH